MSDSEALHDMETILEETIKLSENLGNLLAEGVAEVNSLEGTISQMRALAVDNGSLPESSAAPIKKLDASNDE